MDDAAISDIRTDNGSCDSPEHGSPLQSFRSRPHEQTPQAYTSICLHAPRNSDSRIHVASLSARDESRAHAEIAEHLFRLFHARLKPQANSQLIDGVHGLPLQVI